MASGKSFFGKAASGILGWRFIDLDEEIARRFGSPGSVFAKDGEEGFRKAESETLKEVLQKCGCGERVILALGGGTVLSEGNVTMLRRANARVVWLDTSMDIIWSEIGNSRRPLAEGRTRGELESLLESRRPLYRQNADIVFSIDSFDYDRVAVELSKQLEKLALKSVSVYLGSHSGNDPKFCAVANEFGRKLAEAGYTVVYGGSNAGTMGALAEGAIGAGGRCIGVFPRGFKGKPDLAAKGFSIEMQGLAEMIFTADFAERKKKMAELGDCCVALPGSWGTLDELFTYSTDSELKFNGGKPMFVLNLDGYYDPLKRMVENMYANGFILEHSIHLIRFCNSVDELMEALNNS